MTGNMRSLVRRMLFFLASVVALYLVVGAAASACYREGSVIDNPVPVRRAEGACPDTQQVTLDVSSGQTSQTGVTLYDGDCNAIEAFLSGTSTLIAPDGSSPTLPSSGAVQSAGLWTCEWSWTGEIGGVNVFTFDVSEGFIIQPFSNLTDWQNPPSMDASLTPAGSILYHQTSTNGYALPASQYSPGVYSSLFVHAIGGFKYPRVGITLWEAKHRLDAWVNSPGYATPMCPGTWTLDIDSITDPLPGLGSGGGGLGWEFGCRWMGLSC